MDIYTKFYHNSIDEIKIDTLIAPSKGVAADCRVKLMEAKAIHAWLVQSKS